MRLTVIPRVAGKRREVRREPAQISRAVLDLHRRDALHPTRDCPVCSAVLTPFVRNEEVSRARGAG